MWITNGTLDGSDTGDVYLIYARTCNELRDGLTSFIVEKGKLKIEKLNLIDMKESSSSLPWTMHHHNYHYHYDHYSHHHHDYYDDYHHHHHHHHHDNHHHHHHYDLYNNK